MYIIIIIIMFTFLCSLHIFMQINTCNGWYCDQFTPNSPNSPKIWTENWTGWYIFLLFSLIYKKKKKKIQLYIGFLITLHLRIQVQRLGLERSTQNCRRSCFLCCKIFPISWHHYELLHGTHIFVLVQNSQFHLNFFLSFLSI